jgi:hypothetical protein
VPDPTDLQTLAEALLDAAIEALDTIPNFAPGLEGAPERTFISPGRPALEGCDQLCVNADLILDAQTTPGGLGAGRRPWQGKINHVTLTITIDRCVVDNRTGVDITEPYRAEDLTETAQQTNADAWAIWNHLFNMASAGLLLTMCSELFFDGARALPEEGGRAGWTITLRARLDGYEETLST